jgi:hypothetical protein
MKHKLVFISVGLALSLINCTEQESDREVVMRMLTNAEWAIDEAWIGGEDVTADYNQFTIEFSNSDFRARNCSALWPAEGTWEFEDGTSRAIIRNDGIVVEIRNIDEGQLVLSGNWDIIISPEGRAKQEMTAHSFRFINRQ